jgi:hypothetical protein
MVLSINQIPDRHAEDEIVLLASTNWGIDTVPVAKKATVRAVDSGIIEFVHMAD